jgi:hypothetical protein
MTTEDGMATMLFLHGVQVDPGRLVSVFRPSHGGHAVIPAPRNEADTAVTLTPSPGLVLHVQRESKNPAIELDCECGKRLAIGHREIEAAVFSDAADGNTSTLDGIRVAAR